MCKYLEFNPDFFQNSRRQVCPDRQTQLGYDEQNIKDSIKLTCEANSIIEEINDFGLINFSDFQRSGMADPDEICANIREPTYDSRLFDILDESQEDLRHAYE